MAERSGDRAQTLASLLALGDQAYRLAYHVAGSADLAEDAVQDAYLAAIEHLPRGLPPEETRAYFLRTAANAARKCLRGESRRRRREAAVAQEAKRSEAPQPAAADRELTGALRQALAGLDEDLRLPVALCCQEDLTQREAALVLEVPETTLSGRLREGLESLRRAMEGAGYPAAGAGAATLAEGLRQAAPPVPAGLTAKLQALLAGAAATGAKAAGASTAAAGASLALGWKLLAGASLAALLGLGALGIGRHLHPAAPAAPEPAPAAGDQPPAAPDDAVRRALSAEVTVSRGCMRIHEILLLLHRQCGLRSCWPDQVQSQYTQGVRIPVGRTTAGAVLDHLARLHDLDLETAVHLGRVTAFYWQRPDADAMRRLEALAASQDEVDRCVAARWLPAAGSRRSLSLALEMLADRSERVRRYALFGLAESAPGASWEYRADSLRHLATPGAGRAVADRLREIAADRKAGKPAGTTGSQAVGLACRLGHPDCLPPLLEIVGTELSRERSRFVSGKTPGASWSWSVCPRDPARFQDGSLMAACCEALRGPAAPEAERQVLDFYSRVSGLDRQHFFPALASLAAPAGEQALFALIADPKESEYLKDRAMGALVGSGRREIVDRLSAMAREKGARVDRLVSQFSLRTGSQGILELALARVEAETDAKKRQQLCWDICAATDAGEKVIPVLEKLVEGEDENIRGGSITALGFTGSERAVPVLKRLLNHENRHVSSRAALALGNIGSREATDALIAALTEGSVELRCGAAQALREAGEKRAVPALRDALKSPYPRLRMQAALGLGALGGVEDIDLLLAAAKIPGEAVDERTGQPYERTDPKTGGKTRAPDSYDAAGHAVAQLGVIGGERAAAELVAALKAGTAAAARGLLDSRDPACRRALCRLISEGDRGLADALMRADRLRPPAGLLGLDLVPLLVAWGGEHGLPESSIGDGSWRHNMGDPRQVAALARLLLGGTEAGTRIRAAGLLEVRSLRGARLADPVAAEALLRVSREDRDPKVRAAAIGGPLRSFVREDELTRVLLGLLGDPDPQVREAAARALSPGPYLTEHVPEVRKLLAAERQPGAREAIARLLEDWGRHTADKLPEPEPQPQPPPTPRPPEPAEIF